MPRGSRLTAFFGRREPAKSETLSVPPTAPASSWEKPALETTSIPMVSTGRPDVSVKVQTSPVALVTKNLVPSGSSAPGQTTVLAKDKGSETLYAKGNDGTWSPRFTIAKATGGHGDMRRVVAVTNHTTGQVHHLVEMGKDQSFTPVGSTHETGVGEPVSREKVRNVVFGGHAIPKGSQFSDSVSSGDSPQGPAQSSERR